MALKKSDSSNSVYSIRDTTHVSFVCQQCYQPLRLDHSLYSLDFEVQQDLTAPYPSVPVLPSSINSSGNLLEAQKLLDAMNSPNVVTKVIPPAKAKTTDGNGFMLLGEAASGIKTDSLSHRLKVSAQLFDIMSGNSEIDHPLCEDCTDSLLVQLDEELHVAEKELETYQDLMKTLQAQDVIDESKLSEELAALKLKEQYLLSELHKVEQERESVAASLKEVKEDVKQLEQDEEQYWREYNEHRKTLLDFEDEQASIQNQLQFAQNQLDKLRKINVFNSTFHIWHKGHFGTINGFRLGRLPTVPVEWTEINAAWGQTVLLLHSLAKKIGLNFERYRLVPYGNHSFLECLDDKSKELPLYGSGGFRFFWDTKFDQAMVAFLDCLQQFKQEVEKGDSGFYLPYRMEKGKIYDSSSSCAYSVKIQFNSEEHWTKALKFMLTNLKWGLAWVSSQFTERN